MSVRELFPANGENIVLPGAVLRFMPQWLALAEADALFEQLRAQVAWENHRIRMFGRWVDSPRRSCWMGDANAAYRYSGAQFQPHPWLPSVHALCQRAGFASDAMFNSALLNLYRHGQDAMGWHSDDEPELGHDPVIASVSLGAPRRFLLKRRDGQAQKQSLLLTHGSLLIMAGRTQHEWLHAVPRTTRPMGERINLTFRLIHPLAG